MEHDRQAIASFQVASPRHATASREVDERAVTLLRPSSLEADQYRVLRWQLEQLQRSRGATVVAVSSPGVGDGKTTTAVNLAGALAQDPGTRVLLVDADLRRPAVAGRLGLRERPDEAGLAGALAEPERTLASLVRKRPPFPLAVLPAGQAAGEPFELLRSDRFAELLALARREYQFVILDTPPLLLLPDCRVVAERVDGFLLVVAAHATPRAAVASALNALAPEKVLGIVFNNEDQPRSLYYHRYYSAARRGGRA
ncbi:MAG: CpsD/CapB family tyrosine-protein kinase [Vicinamibacteria bacterium]